ncbi:DUF485 domain-containing protein [uncultured Thiodictyon sp.]|uniref:DUF485 domain-containing protein n=1 Tax=uncultured Thiodictyon sp. TaxID=1846217 RepID=UPI0025FC6493|nr:DUF485 domain-containing protein [uncultured Thiodictyon sp.]
MTTDSLDAITSHPLYAELVSKRKRFGWILTFLMMVIYYGFVLVIAYKKEWLAIPLYHGSITTVGIPVGLAVIISAFLLTGIYVYRANGEFDDLTQRIRENLQ